MSGQWLIFQFLQGHSTRIHGGLVHPSANTQAVGEHPSLFPSGTLAYSQKSTQLHWCEACCSEGGDPYPSIYKSLHEP